MTARSFQCSSASRKFLNQSHPPATGGALPFQCSSASRKFLNHTSILPRGQSPLRFSALQRAENSSILIPSYPCSQRLMYVSVLFSEPKIPQLTSSVTRPTTERVSVLFSEPKIPQSFTKDGLCVGVVEVSVLFSEPKIPQYDGTCHYRRCDRLVSVLFSEPKIPQLKRGLRYSDASMMMVSVLFSEPKIPQCA